MPYIIRHVHRHGTDIHIVNTKKEPSLKEAQEFCRKASYFEDDRDDEHIEVENAIITSEDEFRKAIGKEPRSITQKIIEDTKSF